MYENQQLLNEGRVSCVLQRGKENSPQPVGHRVTRKDGKAALVSELGYLKLTQDRSKCWRQQGCPAKVQQDTQPQSLQIGPVGAGTTKEGGLQSVYV